MKLLCWIGLHPLWTNIYGSNPNAYTCVRCGRRKWCDDE